MLGFVNKITDVVFKFNNGFVNSSNVSNHSFQGHVELELVVVNLCVNPWSIYVIKPPSYNLACSSNMSRELSVRAGVEQLVWDLKKSVRDTVA